LRLSDLDPFRCLIAEPGELHVNGGGPVGESPCQIASPFVE
jgi:hypothetical protein